MYVWGIDGLMVGWLVGWIDGWPGVCAYGVDDVSVYVCTLLMYV